MFFPFLITLTKLIAKTKKHLITDIIFLAFIFLILYHFKINKIMKVEVSNGELLDKLSILELKLLHIKDKNKLVNINKEFSELKPLANNLFKKYKLDIKNYYQDLSEINSKLWKIEDDIRECERRKRFW